MDTNIRFACYCISLRIDLDKVGHYFGVVKNDKRADYIVLKSETVNNVLKYSNEFKEVYLFEFGYISFTNFVQEEIFVFLDFLASIIPINQSLTTKYHEFIDIDNNEYTKVQKEFSNCIPEENAYFSVLPIVLAKSAAIQKIEDGVTVLLDKAENFLNGPLKGSGIKSKKGFINIYSKNLRFQNELVNSIGIYDKPRIFRMNIALNELYSYYTERYELSERLKIINNKKYELNKIMSLYSDMQYKKNSWRLLIIEIILLALFPLSYFTPDLKDIFESAKGYITNLIFSN